MEMIENKRFPRALPESSLILFEQDDPSDGCIRYWVPTDSPPSAASGRQEEVLLRRLAGEAAGRLHRTCPAVASPRVAADSQVPGSAGRTRSDRVPKPLRRGRATVKTPLTTQKTRARCILKFNLGLVFNLWRFHS